MPHRTRDSAPLGAKTVDLVSLTSRAAETAITPEALIDVANGRVDVLERALLLARFATTPRQGPIDRLRAAISSALGPTGRAGDPRKPVDRLR